MSIDFLASLIPLTPNQRRAIDLAGGRIEDQTSADPIPQDYGLVPVGDTGIYVTPNDPVDPRDCSRWPNSPYCNGDGFNPLEPVGADIAISINGCEQCITIQPTVLYLYGPTYTVCYRSGSCRPEPEPPPFDDQYGGDEYRPAQPQPPPGYCRVLYARITRFGNPNPQNFREESQCFASEGAPVNEQVGGIGPAGDFESSRRWSDPDPSIGVWTSTDMTWTSDYYSYCPGGVDSGQQNLYMAARTRFMWRDYPPDESAPIPVNGIGEPVPNWRFISDSCAGGPPPPPPPVDINPPGDEMGCNCSEQEELLRAIYLRLGCEQFPIKVPAQLAGRTNQTTELPDFANVFAWWVYQMDSLIGEWPVEIEIEDDNPLEEGDQRKRVTLPNIAETMAELFGLAYKNDTRGDIDTEILIRMVAELISTKNAALITQDYAKANASFLGYKGNPTKRKIDYAFDPTKLDSLPSLMKESSQYITGYQNDDGENVVAYLERLVFAAGIIKASLMRSGDQAQNWLDSVTNLGADALFQDEGWNSFLNRLNNPEDPLNKGAIPKPDARNATGGDE